jgi:putative ABC transport system permease protein
VNIKENIRIAIFSIRTNLMRSLLTMLGIIIGVSSVIAIVTVGNGGRDYIIGLIRDMGASAINITVDSSVAEPTDYITSADIAAIKQLDGVDYASPIVMGMGAIATETESGIGITLGATPDAQKIMKTDCLYGRFFTEEEYASAKPVAVIDNGSALMVFGREDVVGETIKYTYNEVTVSLKIIGVGDNGMSMFGGNSDSAMESMSALTGGSSVKYCSVMIPASLSLEIVGADDRYESVYITANDENQLESAGNAAQNLIKARHNNFERDCYTVVNMATYIDLLDSVIHIFTIFIAAVSAISLIVGGIGVMNIMLVSITERTREIGIRKALGAKTGTIMFQFLTESIILCIIGGIIGLILGVVGAIFVSHIMNVPLQVKLSTVALAVGFSSAIGIIFGVYPARRAALMPPIEALRRD